MYGCELLKVTGEKLDLTTRYFKDKGIKYHIFRDTPWGILIVCEYADIKQKNSILNNVPHTGHNRIKNVKSMGEANPHVYGILSGMEENYQRCLSLSKKTCRARTIRDAEKKLFGTSRELDEIFSQLKDE